MQIINIVNKTHFQYLLDPSWSFSLIVSNSISPISSVVHSIIRNAKAVVKLEFTIFCRWQNQYIYMYIVDIRTICYRAQKSFWNLQLKWRVTYRTHYITYWNGRPIKHVNTWHPIVFLIIDRKSSHNNYNKCTSTILLVFSLWNTFKPHINVNIKQTNIYIPSRLRSYYCRDILQSVVHVTYLLNSRRQVRHNIFVVGAQ